MLAAASGVGLVTVTGFFLNQEKTVVYESDYFEYFRFGQMILTVTF